MNLDNINPVELGGRIADARRARNLSQDDAAQHLGISRPTYIAIEKGARLVKAMEIVKLAALFGRSVHDLVSAREYVSDFVPQFRFTEIAQVAPEAAEDAVLEFKKICDDYLWLEDLLKVAPPRNRYVDEYLTEGSSIPVAADEVATLERSRLNLGQGPLVEFLSILETEVGLRVFVLPLKDFRIAGMFAYTDRLGGCVLINGKHPRTRQAWSAAHEYAHFLTARYRTEVTVLVDYGRKPRTEQFADLFAASFLMPSAGLRQRFNSVVHGRGDFTVADLCFLADQYGVSVEAMTRRLEVLDCVKAGTWKKLSGSSFDSGKAQRHLSISVREAEGLRLPERYCRLAVQAFEDERITEGQLARLLRCTRVEARETVDAMTRSDEVNSTGEPYQLDLNVGATLDLALKERN